MATHGSHSSRGFRFSRMCRKGKQLDPETIKWLAENMVTGSARKPSPIPAGFTYLGQFIAHDLTFDRTLGVELGERVSPAELLLGRSPLLDLDSLYGAGPHRSARFYEPDALHLRMGRTVGADRIRAKDGFDLPRGPDTRIALIPDERNDDNLAVAQTHLAFIRFHNRVVDSLSRSVPEAVRFARARELVTKHYQWIIRTDYLPRICEASVVDDVFANGRKLFEPRARPTTMPTMPLEFSIGAFRLGHSMVRRSYSWNSRRDDNSVTLALLFRHSAKGGDLGGRDRLASTMIADFRRLYDFHEVDRPDLHLTVDEHKFNRAMRIDTSLVAPLKNLPAGAFGGPEMPADDPAANLAFRNLTRASMVQLATGQDMVALLAKRGVAVTPLEPEQIATGPEGRRLAGFRSKRQEALATDTPLWFYVLREAELNEGRLTGVGARIVAEMFHRAMEASRASIVRDRAWRPTLGPDENTFRMVDLLLFASREKRAVLAPLG